MKWEVWLLFVMTEAVLSLTPGPAVLYVLSQAIRRGPAKSVWASWGILSANAAYFVLSATSLGAVIVASYKLFFLIKWAPQAPRFAMLVLAAQVVAALAALAPVYFLKW